MMGSWVAIVLCFLYIVSPAQAVVYGWGKNDQAQLGLGSQTAMFTPTAIPFYQNIPLLDVLTATNYHLALASNGSVYGCGLQYYGQFALGYTSTTAIKTPVLCSTLSASLDIVLPGTSCNANMNTNLLGWGNLAGYVQGKTTGAFPKVQTALSTYKLDGKVLSVHSVMEGTIVRLGAPNNTVYVAGTNINGRLGNGNANTIYNFVEATFWRTTPLRQIFSSQSSHACAVATNSSLYCWGQNDKGQLGVGDTSSKFTPTRVAFFDSIYAEIYKVVYGDTFTMVLTCGGKLYAMGANNYGQLGQVIPDSNPHPVPVEVTSTNWNNNIVEVVTGIYQTYVRTDTGKWYVWGGGANGGLATGDSNDVYSPKENTVLFARGINRVKSSSQSLNFFGWYDGAAPNTRIGCPTMINECAPNATNSCDNVNGYCVDYDRGYGCNCRPGWIGDGYTTGSGCINMYSCQATQCVANATCDDSSGFAVCKCPLGSDGDGLVSGSGCTDIDECAAGNPCASNSICTNQAPGYNCSCLPGFVGDPVYSGCTILCQPGQYATNLTNCDLCPPGTYTDVSAAQNCFPCPGGTYNSAWGSDSLGDCTRCPVGGYSEPKATYCSLCVHGYTNDPSVLHTDNTTCTACPLGSYGYYGVCYPCEQGKFSISAVAQQCHYCKPGYKNAGTGALSCDICPAGTVSRGGTTNCLPCAAGYYSSAGSKDCQKCPPGTSTNGLTGQTSCSNCTAGTYNSKSAAQNCLPSPAGTYTSVPGASAYRRCPQGTFAASPSSTSCTPCTGGMFTSDSGSTTCIACPSGSVSTDGKSCAPCNAGNYFDSTSRTCKPCAPGTFVAVTGANACFACTQGSYTEKSGSTYCKRCDVNTYSTANTGFTNCAACPPGTYSTGGAYACN